jgi:hypothetical protein
MRVATVARIALGSACLAVPTQLLALVGGLDRDDTRTRAIVRVLGARLALQAGADLWLGPRTRKFDVGVDLVHAASMLPVAALWPAHRRTALVSAAIATGTATLDAAAGRSVRYRSPQRD